MLRTLHDSFEYSQSCSYSPNSYIPSLSFISSYSLFHLLLSLYHLLLYPIFFYDSLFLIYSFFSFFRLPLLLLLLLLLFPIFFFLYYLFFYSSSFIYVVFVVFFISHCFSIFFILPYFFLLELLFLILVIPSSISFFIRPVFPISFTPSFVFFYFYFFFIHFFFFFCHISCLLLPCILSSSFVTIYSLFFFDSFFSIIPSFDHWVSDTFLERYFHRSIMVIIVIILFYPFNFLSFTLLSYHLHSVFSILLLLPPLFVYSFNYLIRDPSSTALFVDKYLIYM